MSTLKVHGLTLESLNQGFYDMNSQEAKNVPANLMVVCLFGGYTHIATL